MSLLIENVIWIVGTGIIGFAVAAVFAGKLRLRRNAFLLAYVPISAALLCVFLIRNEVDILRVVSRNWIWGIVGAVVAGAISVKNVLSQRPYPRKNGGGFLVDILWPGFTYGLIDGLILSVLPILAVKEALATYGWTEGWLGLIGVSAIALVASVFVTVAYHLGYPEFRGKRVFWAVLGNGVFSLAYLITLNPLAAVIPHIAMHITAVVHGRETTIQLPPHYESVQRAA
jgi:hypothetical protein